MKTNFLVAYEYGQGAVWAFIRAGSAEEIAHRFPELTVVDVPPASLTRAELDRIQRTMSFDVDSAEGWLAELEDARPRTDRPGG